MINLLFNIKIFVSYYFTENRMKETYFGNIFLRIEEKEQT